MKISIHQEIIKWGIIAIALITGVVMIIISDLAHAGGIADAIQRPFGMVPPVVCQFDGEFIVCQ